MKPIKTVVDCSTGEIAYVELTDAEIEQQKKDAIEYEKQKKEQEAILKAEQDAKESAMAKLAKLGLSDEEVKAIING